MLVPYVHNVNELVFGRVWSARCLFLSHRSNGDRHAPAGSAVANSDCLTDVDANLYRDPNDDAHADQHARTYQYLDGDSNRHAHQHPDGDPNRHTHRYRYPDAHAN